MAIKRLRRMVGGGGCPPGVFCLSTESMIFILIVIVAAVGFFIYAQKNNNASDVNRLIIQERQEAPQPQTIVNVKGDDRYSMAPKPERMWYNGPDLDYPRAAIPIGVPTRGLPEAYHIMGVLKGSDDKMQPLYGRRTAGSSNRYNYYTRTDTYNPVPLPLQYKRRDCQDDTGCDEIFDGEEMHIGPTGEKVKASLYKMSSIFL